MKFLASAGAVAAAVALNGLIAGLPPSPATRPLPAILPAEAHAPAAGPVANGGNLLASLPLAFEKNEGQTDPSVAFLSRGPGYTLFLTHDATAVLSLRGSVPPSAAGEKPEPGPGAVVRMELIGSAKRPMAAAHDPLPGRSNYFIGSDQSKWRTNVGQSARASFKDVYPGIDVVYYGTNQRQLEYDFVVAPGADPGRIALRFEGARDLRLDHQGNLVLLLATGEVLHRAPIAYQEDIDGRDLVPARFRIVDSGVQFDIDAFDRTRPLIIDPVLAYSTYLGGSLSDQAFDVAADATGASYVTGYTNSTNFPSVTPLQGSLGGSLDAFVIKFTSSGAVQFSTYLGGAGEDYGRAIALDSVGNLYVAGFTDSSNYPTTATPYQTDRPGRDGFITKLGPTGATLMYSTYLGGTGTDYIADLAVDPAGAAYVTGQAGASDFPTLNPYRACASGLVFITKLAVSGGSINYSTCFVIGGPDGGSIAVDSAGQAYLTGEVNPNPSTNPLPTTAGAYQETSRGGTNTDAFVTKFASSGNSLVYSTYLSGSLADVGTDIVVANDGSAYVSGWTGSTDYPLLNAADTTVVGGQEGFLTKVNATGSGIVFSTFLGGSGVEVVSGLAVDGGGSAYVTGRTFSVDLTVVDPVQGTHRGGGNDAFVIKMTPGGLFAYSTYLGSPSDDQAEGIATDGQGGAFVVGSLGFPGTGFQIVGAYQPTYRGGSTDGFVTAILDRPRLSIADAAVLEGNTGIASLTFIATLSVAPAQQVTVSYATSNGTAVAGTDYSATSGALTFAPGVTSQSLAVNVFGDTTVEGDETFTVVLSGVSGADIVDGTALGTIIGDDEPLPQLSARDLVVAEGNSGSAVAALGVTLSPARGVAVTVQYATADGTANAGSDYTAASGTLTIPAGSTSASIPVTIIGDTQTEGRESLLVMLSNATYAAVSDDRGDLVINDDDTALGITSNLVANRSQHTATLMLDGTVLVRSNATAESYDPATRGWQALAAPSVDRVRHAAALLPSGKLLVTGGMTAGSATNTTEVYDPATSSWSAGTLTAARADHTATLLADGRLLVVGGANGAAKVAPAEIYSAASGWASAGNLTTARSSHTATRLADGRVLVAGGSGSLGLVAPAEIYTPGGGWAAAGTLNNPRSGHCATVLADGKVVIAGGSGASAPLATAEIYNPGTNSWTATGSLALARQGHACALLNTGEVLVAGGTGTGGVDVLDTETYLPSSGTWARAGRLTVGRVGPTATALPDGRVLIAGGSGSLGPTAELFDPSAAHWASAGPLTAARTQHTATLLPDGRVLGVGSAAGADLFDPTSATWSSTNAPSAIRSAHTATLLASGPSTRVLVAGGRVGGTETAAAQVYDPATGWADTDALDGARAEHTATLLPDRRVLVAGGRAPGGAVRKEAELYGPVSGLWSPATSMGTARYGHAATALDSGEVLVTGGGDGTQELRSAEIFDPRTGAWRAAAAPAYPRRGHVAVLLRDGRVLVAGGVHLAGQPPLAAAEVYDPGTDTWSGTGSMRAGRDQARATLLWSGAVLVTGGYDGASWPATAELFDPATGQWTTFVMTGGGRQAHTATVIASGKVLIAGGTGATGAQASSALFDPGPRGRAMPVITAANTALAYDGAAVTVMGTGFRGDSHASSGGTADSATNYALLEMRSMESGRIHTVTVDGRANFSAEPATLTAADLPDGLESGWHLLRVVTAGVPSAARAAHVDCSVDIDQSPQDVLAALGGTAQFTVVASGARSYQWKRNGFDIQGATDSSYTTPPITGSDVGAGYSVTVTGNCVSKTSAVATLRVDDPTPPSAAVVSPSGGEYWLLSTPNRPPNTQLVTWSMSDNVRICEVKAALLYSNDGGTTYSALATGTGLPESYGPGGTCASPGEGRTSVLYTIPTAFPSGVAASLYKVRVEVKDHAGLVTTVTSANPFYIVQSNPDSVRTLILSNVARMQAPEASGGMGISAVQAAALRTKLQELANHPRVQGFVVDLSTNTDVAELLAAWDGPGTGSQKVSRANAVLFGCHGSPLPSGCAEARDGIHDTIRDLLRAYTGVRSMVLVGDDRIIPFARVPDGASLLPESTYAGSVDLGPGSTVAQALEANHFLSDDPLGIADAVSAADLASQLLVPDLAVGRLVETPAEITTTIATFISQDGVLDLEALDAETGHKTLVTGYDFLDDSARKVRKRWKQVLGTPPGQDADLAPVDGVLLGGSWGIGTVADRICALRRHLSGNGGARYGVMSLSGHATHYEEGVPGETGPLDIQGLGAIDIYGAGTCSAPAQGALSLAGGVIYAVGCHGGLTVPGSSATDTDHSLDLPQTFLSKGVVAYVANTGYGWGLKHGIGYGERLSELFTEQMTKGGTVAVGEAVKAAKQRYFLESPRADVYDKKSLMQWTLYGLPMYAVRTGLEASSASVASKTRADGVDGVEEQRLGAVTVESRVAGGEPSAAPLPDFLTSLSLHFNFSAPGVYVKRDSSGRDATENPALGNPGCPDLDGCYYTLNGLVDRSTGHTDLPVQPYFVYDSRLSGTSQHGVLWTGGVYVQETGWRPVIAQLASNATISTDHGAAARRTMIGGVPRGIVPGVNPDNCRPSDLEVNTLVITTGEASKVLPTDATYTIERRLTQVDLEAFYFNDTSASSSNCDRTPPELGTPPFAGRYHRAVGTTLSFAVPVTDASSVWRVMVVTDDEQANGLGQQTWDPLELDFNVGTGRWEGSLTVSPSSRVTYVVQAADRRGNVVFAEYVAPVLLSFGSLSISSPLNSSTPASGVPLGILDTVDAPTVTGLSPGNGPVGTTVTVSGRNLVGATSVKVGGISASFSNVTETSLQLVVPAGAVAGAVEVATPGGLAESAGTYGVQAPSAVTQSATSVSLNGATLNGSVNPNGLATSVHFDYGTTTAYGISTTSQSAGSGSIPQPVSEVVAGLGCGTTYHFRIVAENAHGSVLGGDVSFSSPSCPPNVTTSPASSVTLTTVTLNGAVNPRGTAGTGQFEYGVTAAYGSQTGTQSVGSGKVDVPVSTAVSGLGCATMYHYRAIGTSGGGTRTGGDLTFTTLGCGGLSVSIGDAVVREGSAPEPSRYRTAELVVSLSANSPGGVSVNYLAGPGSAAEGTDFVATSGTLVFAVGERTGTIRIPIVGDGVDEGPESFTVTLSSPSGVTLDDAQGVVTIVDDDGNTTSPNAHFAMIGETQSDSLSATRTEAWFKAALTAGRSYAAYAWAGHADADEVAGGPSLAASVFLDDGTTPAPGVVSHADHQAATSGHAGVLRTIIPAGTGTFRLKVSAASTPSAPYEIHVMLVETTLVAPYWQVVIAAGFDAAPQIRNNTAAPVTVQFTAYAPDGTVQCSNGLTIPANGISTFAMGGPAPGCGTTVGFGSAQLAHHGPPGAITGNITTFGAASGLSFDAPFVPRNRWTSMGITTRP